jgi:glycerol dehydrogenase-like iron-containing ADH family enzyme
MELLKATVIEIAKYVSEVIRLCYIIVPTTIPSRPGTTSFSNREDA